MALRFYYEFKNRQEVDYRVELHDANFSGTAYEVTAQADGFILSYEGQEEDIFMPIVGSHCELPVVNRASYSADFDDFLDDLVVSDEDRFTVAIYLDPDGANTLYWAGVIAPEQTTYEDKSSDKGQLVTLVAVDDLSALKYVDYNNDGTAYTDVASVASHALNCLKKTRTSLLFWGTDDVFLSVGELFAYNDGTDYQPLDEDFAIAHGELYEIDEYNTIQWYSCYKVLESICKTFMYSAMQVGGRWVLFPRHIVASDTTPTFTNWKRGGVKIAEDQSLINARVIGTAAGNVTRYADIEETHLNAVREVRIQHNYDGNLPIISEGPIAEADIEGFSATASDWIVPSGETLTVYFNFSGVQNEDATRTGNARALRYKLSLTIQCGSYYLKRIATQGGASTFYIDDPGTAQVENTEISLFGFAYPTAEWTTTSSDEVEFFSAGVDAWGGDNINMLASIIISPDMPADAANITVTINSLEAYEADGTTSAAITTAALADAVIQMGYLKARIGGGNAGGHIIYSAEDDNNARDIVDLGTTLIGDQVSTLASKGAIRFSSDGSHAGGNFYRLGDVTTKDLMLRMLVRQHLSQRNLPTKIIRGTLYHDQLYFYDYFTYQSRTWLPFASKFNANKSEWEIDLFHLRESYDGITLAEEDKDNKGGTLDDEVIILGTGLSDLSDTVATTADKLDGIQPADTGAIYVKNDVDDTYSVILKSAGGLKADNELKLPSDQGTQYQLMATDGNGNLTFDFADRSAIQVRYTEAVSAGDPIYITGYNAGQNRVEVGKADASNSAKMPSFGVADAAYSANDNGTAVSLGILEGLDTSTFTVGQTLYVASGGGLTNTKPTGTNLIQNVGKVGRAHANGLLVVMAIGRSNDVPNLGPGLFFIGTSTNTTASAYRLPLTDGTSGQVLTTDGAGSVTFQTPSGGGGGGGKWAHAFSKRFYTYNSSTYYIGDATYGHTDVSPATGITSTSTCTAVTIYDGGILVPYGLSNIGFEVTMYSSGNTRTVNFYVLKGTVPAGGTAKTASVSLSTVASSTGVSMPSATNIYKTSATSSNSASAGDFLLFALNGSSSSYYFCTVTIYGDIT